MKFIRWLFVIVAIALGSACTPNSVQESSPPETASTTASGVSVQSETSVNAWREDLNYLAQRMIAVHPNLFWRVSEGDFQTAVSGLEEKIPTLSNEQIIVEFARIASLIDGHTHLPLFQTKVSFHLYPLRLYLFPDGLFVVDADDDHRDLIGGRVVSIGNTPIEEALASVSPLVPRDNEMTIRLLAPVYLTIPEVLQALEVIEDLQRPAFTFEYPDGQSRVVNLMPQATDRYRDWTSLFIELAGLPRREEPMYLERREEYFWHTLLPDQETLYFQFNRVQQSSPAGLSLTRAIEQVESDLANQPVQTAVLDLRNNPGGNVHASMPLTEWVSENNQINRQDHLFVLIGRQTFSAATLFAVDLEQATQAIFVGEPTGGRPNLYADTTPVVLPNSGISVMVSTIYWERSSADDERDWIAPDIPVMLTSAEFFDGHDPALNAILETIANETP